MRLIPCPPLVRKSSLIFQVTRSLETLQANLSPGSSRCSLSSYGLPAPSQPRLFALMGVDLSRPIPFFLGFKLPQRPSPTVSSRRPLLQEIKRSLPCSPAPPEVKSFEIVIDSNQNATVQPITPENQAVLARSEAIEAQANTVAQEEEFDSPLWVFGFFTLIILILILNSVSRGMRNRA